MRESQESGRDPKPERSSSTSAAKALRILRYILEHSTEDVSATDLHHALGIPRSSVYRLMRDLQDMNFVVLDEATGKYRTSHEVYHLASALIERGDYLEIVRSALDTVVSKAGETAIFGVYTPASASMMVAHVVETDKPVRYTVQPGGGQSICQGASGKGILAWLSDEEVRSVLTRSRERGERIDEKQLLAELEAIRAQGYAMTRGEKIEGAIGVSAPVFAGHRSPYVLGDLIVTIPEFRSSADLEKRAIEIVCETAASLSDTLSRREV